MADYAGLMDLTGLPEPTEWQKRVLEEMLFPREGTSWRQALVHGGRSAGRASADRRALRVALAAGGHVHVAAKGGSLWCVTGTGEQLTTFGPLWERLATYQCQPVRVIYDEPLHLGGQGQ